MKKTEKVKNKKTAKLKAIQLENLHAEHFLKLGDGEEEINFNVGINDWKGWGCLLNTLRFNPARCGHLAKAKSKK